MEHLTTVSPPVTVEPCRSAELPLVDLLWHEEIEPGRLTELAARLTHERLREPIHVARTQMGHLIVDGAHRARAMALLGRETIRCHVLSMADELPVPGWTHLVSDRAGERLLHRAQAAPPVSSDPARPLAQVIGPRGSAVVWTLEPTSAGRLGDARELARLYQHEPYLRQSPDEAVRSDRWAITWVLPSWGELSRIVGDHGPFPAGVTRLGGAIDAVCPGRRFGVVRRTA